VIKLLYALGLLQIVGGVLVAMAAKSAIHEILGAIAFGMGVLAIGLAAVISRIAEVGMASETQVELMRDIKDGRRV
jgi:Na+/phosphate symporter